MADQIKEFVNTEFTGADLTNGDEYALITTDANTTAVIKDINVESSDLAADQLDLLVNDYRIGGAESLSGTELVGTSSNVVYKLQNGAPSGTYLSTSVYYDTSYGNTRKTTNQISAAANYEFTLSGAGDPVTSTVTLPSGGGDSLGWVTHSQYVEDNYPSGRAWVRFRYDGNSTTYLYAGSGSPSSISWTTIDTNSYAYKALDWENYIVYWVSGGNLRRYDMKTNSTTGVGHSAPTESTYSHGSFCNGYYFYIPSNSYTSTVYTIKDSDGTTDGKGVTHYGAGDGGGIAVVYNSDENAYYMLTGNTSNANARLAKLACTTANGVIGSESWTDLGEVSPHPFHNGAVLFAYKGNQVIGRSPTNDNVVIASIANDTVTVDYAFDDALTVYSNWTPAPDMETSTGTVAATDFNIKIKCRVTGIESA